MSDLAETFAGAVALPQIDVSSEPGAGAHRFVQSQLNSGGPQVHQYDPQAGLITALEWGRIAPGMGALKAFGLYPDGRGGFEPSLLADMEAGRVKESVLDAIGLGGAGLTLFKRGRKLIGE